jgi:hypothetical protein
MHACWCYRPTKTAVRQAGMEGRSNTVSFPSCRAGKGLAPSAETSETCWG